MTERERPTVSVFIQTYNHERFIAEAIDGVLAQRTPFPVEVLIADDCSTDSTREIVRAYAERYPERIELLLPDRNVGANELSRRGLAKLRGRYHAWLDGDDYWTAPEKLTRQVEMLERHPDWSACFHDATLVYDDASQPPRAYVPALDKAVVGVDDLLKRDFVPSLSVVTRGDLLRPPPDWVWASRWCDWMFLLALALRGPIGYLPETMGVYRLHPRGVASQLTREEQILEDLELYRVLREALPAGRRGAVEELARDRRCQLAVERAELPYDGPVLTLGEERETPTYLNGRDVWPLIDAPVTISELERLDRGGSLSARFEESRAAALERGPSSPHFKTAYAARRNGRSAYLLAAGRAVEWLQRYSRFGLRLDASYSRILAQECCAVYDLSTEAAGGTSMGALVEVTEVERPSAPPAELVGSYVDIPVPGRTIDAHAVEVMGWALGEAAPVVAVEFAVSGEVFRRAPTGMARRDLAAAFPSAAGAGTAGFRTTLNLAGATGTVEVELRAVLGDQRRVPFATIRGRRRWREAVGAEDALVSVIVPCFQQAHYLSEAIESVLAQTHPHFEVVVVDDGSSDNTGRVCSRYPGVRHVRQHNSGRSAARNLGIRESDGDLLVFLDADDRLLPRALESGLQAMRAHPEAAYVFGRYRRIGADGVALEADQQPRRQERPYATLLRYNYAGMPATGMFRRSVFEHIGGFDSAAEPAEDYEVALRTARSFAVHAHDDYVADHREHGANTVRAVGTMMRSTLRVLRRERPHVRDDQQLHESYRAGLRFWRGYYGEPLAAETRSNVINREWRRALQGVATLAVHHPSGLSVAIGRRPPRSQPGPVEDPDRGP